MADNMRDDLCAGAPRPALEKGGRLRGPGAVPTGEANSPQSPSGPPWTATGPSSPWAPSAAATATPGWMAGSHAEEGEALQDEHEGDEPVRCGDGDLPLYPLPQPSEDLHDQRRLSAVGLSADVLRAAG